jgi:hypothetical protein
MVTFSEFAIRLHFSAKQAWPSVRLAKIIPRIWTLLELSL